MNVLLSTDSGLVMSEKSRQFPETGSERKQFPKIGWHANLYSKTLSMEQLSDMALVSTTPPEA
jgi:hypothetical protein